MRWRDESSLESLQLEKSLIRSSLANVMCTTGKACVVQDLRCATSSIDDWVMNCIYLAEKVCDLNYVVPIDPILIRIP